MSCTRQSLDVSLGAAVGSARPGSPWRRRLALRRGPGGASGTGDGAPHAGGTATGPTGGVALIAIGAAAIPMYVDVCIIPRRVYTRRRNTGAPVSRLRPFWTYQFPTALTN